MLEAKHIELIMESILKLNNLRMLNLSNKWNIYSQILIQIQIRRTAYIGGNKIGNKSRLIGELLQATEVHSDYWVLLSVR